VVPRRSPTKVAGDQCFNGGLLEGSAESTTGDSGPRARATAAPVNGPRCALAAIGLRSSSPCPEFTVPRQGPALSTTSARLRPIEALNLCGSERRISGPRSRSRAEVRVTVERAAACT